MNIEFEEQALEFKRYKDNIEKDLKIRAIKLDQEKQLLITDQRLLLTKLQQPDLEKSIVSFSNSEYTSL